MLWFWLDYPPFCGGVATDEHGWIRDEAPNVKHWKGKHLNIVVESGRQAWRTRALGETEGMNWLETAAPDDIARAAARAAAVKWEREHRRYAATHPGWSFLTAYGRTPAQARMHFREGIMEDAADTAHHNERFRGG